MSGRHLAAAVMVLAVAAPAAYADNAKPRGGGGSSSSGSSHSSHGSGGSSGGGSSSSSGYHGGGSHPSSGGDLTGAQRRHPRAGTGTGYRYGYYPYYGGGYYGGGYYGGYYPYYSPYYSPYYWGYGSYPWGGLYFDSYWGGGAGYGYGGGGGYVAGTYSEPSSGDDRGAIRLMIDKPKAKVYVDGYYAGIVDDFDGLLQRLYVSAGRHDITIKLEGYKTEHFDVYVQDDSTVKIQHQLVQGTGDERNSEYAPLGGAGAPPDARADQGGDREKRYEARPEQQRPEGQGMVRLNVRPDDASIYVDGSFSGSARELARLQLPAGRHRVEIVRPGYRTYDHDVNLDAGQNIDLSVDLDR